MIQTERKDAVWVLDAKNGFMINTSFIAGEKKELLSC